MSCLRARGEGSVRSHETKPHHRRDRATGPQTAKSCRPAKVASPRSPIPRRSRPITTPANDQDRLIAALRRDLALDQLTLPPEYFYASLPLCVIDSVFSIGVRYEGVRRTVARWCAFAGWPQFRGAGAAENSISDFLAVCANRSDEALADVAFGNRQRTSAKSGILKAEAARRFAEVLQANGAERLGLTDDPARNAQIAQAVRCIPGQGSGISFEYFLMLAGSDRFVKADRMICRYVGRALGHPAPVQPELARDLLTSAADELGIAPRTLDYGVWSLQRNLA